MNQLEDQTAQDPHSVRPDAGTEGSPGGTEVILLAEDEAFVREVAAEVLRRAGYQVWASGSEGEALRIHGRLAGQIDLLIADVVLPGKNGRLLAEELRVLNPNLPVLLVSGYELAAEDARHRGEECLAKPFSAESLLRRVRQMLDGGGRCGLQRGTSSHDGDNEPHA